MITYNGIDIPITVIKNKKYINFNYWMLCHRNFNGKCIVTYEIRKLPVGTWEVVKKGRNVTYYVDGTGVIDFIQRSISMPITIKKDIIEQLKQDGMIDKTTCITYYARKEISFYSDLIDFMSVFGKKVLSQVICDGFLIDFVIEKYAIEYDENGHEAYNKEKEIKRAETIVKNGYKLIRVIDKNTNIKNIAIIVNAMGGL
jgi:hypothetical protein